MNKDIVLLELHYLPSLEYFACLEKFETIILEQHEFYEKQSYRNRCYILGANKIEMLSIPILNGNKKQLIRDVKIDYSERWTTIHWRTIEAAYRKAPFFEYFADYFVQLYEQKPVFLWELNYDFLKLCLKLAKINKTISFSETYVKEPSNNVLDTRLLIHPKKSWETNPFYSPIKYHQNFGNEFVPNLSVIDQLFCKGNLS